MDMSDKRIWYIVAAVLVLIVIGYGAGWFGGSTPAPEETTTAPATQ
jgi:hypothetical protein